jgi:hypothetical protein
VTIASRPSCGTRRLRHESDLPRIKSGKFFARGLDTIFLDGVICPTGRVCVHARCLRTMLCPGRSARPVRSPRPALAGRCRNSGEGRGTAFNRAFAGRAPHPNALRASFARLGPARAGRGRVSRETSARVLRCRRSSPRAQRPCWSGRGAARPHRC